LSSSSFNIYFPSSSFNKYIFDSIYYFPSSSCWHQCQHYISVNLSLWHSWKHLVKQTTPIYKELFQNLLICFFSFLSPFDTNDKGWLPVSMRVPFCSIWDIVVHVFNSCWDKSRCHHDLFCSCDSSPYYYWCCRFYAFYQGEMTPRFCLRYSKVSFNRGFVNMSTTYS